MEEQFLGGVAALGMNRTVRGFRSSFYVQTGGPAAYGIYLTDQRLVGVSYQKIVSKAYRPAYLVFLIWIISLGSLVAYAGLTGAKDLPPLPFVMGLAVVALVLLVYWSPNQASNRVQREMIKSTEALRLAAAEISLDRDGISRILVQPTKITVTMKSGDGHTFICSKRRKMLQLLELLQRFCFLDPHIELVVSDASGRSSQTLVANSPS